MCSGRCSLIPPTRKLEGIVLVSPGHDQLPPRTREVGDTGGRVQHSRVQFGSGSAARPDPAHEPAHVSVKGWVAGNGVEANAVFQASRVPVQAGVAAAAGGLRVCTEVQGGAGLRGAEVWLRAVSKHRFALWRAAFKVGRGRLHRALHLQAVELFFGLSGGRGLAHALELVLAVRERRQAFPLRLGGGHALAAAPCCDSDALVALEPLVVLLQVQHGGRSAGPVRPVDLPHVSGLEGESDQEPVVVVARAGAVRPAATGSRVLQQGTGHA